MSFQVYSVQSNYQFLPKNKKPSEVHFGSTRAIYSASGYNLGRIDILNQSDLFRNDMHWAKFIDLLYELFPNGVKTSSLACSDGSEPVTLAISLIDKLGRKANSFFPIYASDIHPQTLQCAKSGIIGVENGDITRINKQLKQSNFSDYFIKANPEKYAPEVFSEYYNIDFTTPSRLNRGGIASKFRSTVSGRRTTGNKFVFEKYHVKPELLNLVKFSVADARVLSERSFDAPEVILLRNFFYLLKNEDQFKIASNYYSKLKPGSLMVLGFAEDLNCNFSLMKSVGFKQLRDSSIYSQLSNKCENDKYIFRKD